LLYKAGGKVVYFGKKNQRKAKKSFSIFNEKLKGVVKKGKKIEYSKYKNPSCEAIFQFYEEKDPIKINMINELKGFLHVCKLILCIFTSKSLNLKFYNHNP